VWQVDVSVSEEHSAYIFSIELSQAGKVSDYIQERIGVIWAMAPCSLVNVDTVFSSSAMRMEAPDSAPYYVEAQTTRQ
jgi:hypothetical protein